MTEKTIYHMSSCGYCPKRLGYRRLEYNPLPTPDWLGGAAIEGKWHETRIINELKEEGYEIYDEQREYTLESDSLILQGHIEGKLKHSTKLVKYQTDVQLLEIKSMSLFESPRWMHGRFLEFPWYADQVTCYMTATNLSTCRYIVKNRDNGHKDDRVLEATPSNFADIVARLEEIEKKAQQGKLVDRSYSPDNIECRRFCEFRHHCMPPAPVLGIDQEKQLFEATDKWRRGKALEKEAIELIEAGATILEAQIANVPQKKYTFDSLFVQSVFYKEQETYPKAKLLEVFTKEQLAPACQIKVAYEQLRIKDLAKESND